LAVLVLFLSTGFAWEVSYEGHQVARCQLRNRDEADWLLDLQASTDLDIWSMTQDYADVHLVPNDKISQDIQESLQCEIRIQDLEAHFQESAPLPADHPLGDFYDQFPTYDQIVQKCRDLNAAYPTLTKFDYLGSSLEGRPMPYLVITGNTSAIPSKWNFYIQGGLHAREWASPVTTLFIAEALLVNYTRGEQNTTYLMNRVVHHIVPITNPDGYNWSWTNDRNWRKNRRYNNPSYGVDLNRNFDDHWGGTGSSGVPSSDTYRGPSIASEPETQAIARYVAGLTRRIGGIDYHAYGPLVLRSWGWTTAPSSDESWLKPIGDGWASAINAVFRQNYVSEKAAELYPASGCADDWMSAAMAMQGHGWTIELRGNSFTLPAAQIRACGIENYVGFLYMERQLVNRFGSYEARHPQPFHLHSP